MKRILIIGYANKYFRTEYVKNIKNKDIIFDILTFEKCTVENRKLYNRIIECETKSGKWNSLLTYIKFFFCIVTLQKYDAIHIHSVKLIESIYSFILKLKCKTLISSIYGSDIYRINLKKRNYLKPLFKNSNFITVATKEVAEDFIKYFGDNYRSKIKIISFGLSQLNYIDGMIFRKEKIKEELSIPKESVVITIGYNATKEQHHIEILEQIKKNYNKNFKNIFLIIPMSYGDKVYREKVVKRLKILNIPGKCFCDYWPIEDVGKLRVISDIMIQVQDTDMFSASMNEYLYAGNVIITGSWLPYKIIQEYIITVDNLKEVSNILIDVINQLGEYKGKIDNAKKFLYKRYSWEAVKDSWINLYK